MHQENSHPDVKLPEALRSVVPSGTSENDLLELSITIDESGLNVREMSSYLEFIDRVYGRLISDGLRSYAHRPDLQIQVTEIRQGSMEMLFQELFANLDMVSATIILGLILKYLPEFLESLASAHKDVEEAKLIRLQREQLRRQLEKDKQMESLSSQDLQQLTEYMVLLYQSEARLLPASGRFADKYVKNILLRITENEP